MKTATDMQGNIWRIDEVIRGAKASKAQITPGFVQVNISPLNSKTRNHRGIQLLECVADRWIDGTIRLKIA